MSGCMSENTSSTEGKKKTRGIKIERKMSYYASRRLDNLQILLAQMKI
jgi:hypothetical protein